MKIQSNSTFMSFEFRISNSKSAIHTATLRHFMFVLFEIETTYTNTLVNMFLANQKAGLVFLKIFSGMTSFSITLFLKLKSARHIKEKI